MRQSKQLKQSKQSKQSNQGKVSTVTQDIDLEKQDTPNKENKKQIDKNG